MPAATPRWHSYLGSHRLPASKALSCRAIPLSLGKPEGKGNAGTRGKTANVFFRGENKSDK